MRKSSLSWWALAALLAFALLVACVPILASCAPRGPSDPTQEELEGIIADELIDTIPGAVCRIANAASGSVVVDFLCAFVEGAPPVRTLATGDDENRRAQLTTTAPAAPFLVRVRRERAAAFAKAHEPKD